MQAARADIYFYFVLLILFSGELAPVPDVGQEYSPA
jgi:hypothetical protein